MAKKVKHPKLDPYFISLKQRYELRYIVNKFTKEGYILNESDVRLAVKMVGKSRKKVYNVLRTLPHV